MSREPAPVSEPIPDKGVRIPAALPVMVLLRSAEGEPLEHNVRAAHTRDVNEGGLGLEIDGLPQALAEQLSTSRKVQLDIDARIGKRTLRLTGHSTWLRVSERRGQNVALVGVEFAEASLRTAQVLVRLAKKRAERSTRWRVITYASLFLAVAGAFVYWRVHVANLAKLASVESELTSVAHELTSVRASAQQGQSELAQSVGEVAGLRLMLADGEQKLAKKMQDLENVRIELAYARERLRDLTASLDALARVPPAGLEQSAVYHLERGRRYWERNNEAAALLEFERAVALDSSLAIARRELAEANYYFGRVDKALAEYRRYLVLAPKAEDAADILATIAEIEGASSGKSVR